jgi:beta-aspartyl-peptidase (threonine type)
MPIAIIVHGGAGNIPAERRAAAHAGCQEAARIGWRILQNGGSALDAVEAAARSLEDNPLFNAGTGACLNRDGRIELDAGIMEGHTLQVGAIAGIECIKHPITVARRVLESPHVLLISGGAQEFAQEHGIPLCDPEDLITDYQYQQWQRLLAEEEAQKASQEPRYHRREFRSVTRPEEQHGTIGAVAIDNDGNLAAATSTGGIHNKYHGRVGDSPLVGSGFYADENAAISCTGQGEDFMRLLIAKRAADFVARGDTARTAAEAAIAVLGAKASGTGGLIVVDRLGNVGSAWNSQHMTYAYMLEGQPEPAGA